MLESEAAAAVCLLDQLASVVVATIGNVFEWEFEVMSELYNSVSVAEEDPAEENSEHLHGNLDFDEHSSLNCEVRGDQMEPPLKNSEEESKLLESDHVGTGDGASLKSISNSDPATPSRESEVSRSNETSDSPRYYAREVSPELSLEKSRRSEALVDSHSSSFVPQTPERSCEILAHPSLVRRAKQRRGVSESLSRSVSMRITNDQLHKQSTLVNCEAVQGPNEIFWECSEKTELSKSQSMRTPSIRDKIREGRGRALGSNLKRDESMGREKEWRRTLACKLYEERMSFKIREERKVDEGAEEMDLLWEAYEADADKLKNTVKSGGKKKILVKEEEEEEEEEDEDEAAAQLCCLQALRMSTGKMKLGVGRPNLAKISKAFKGIGGLLHRSGSRSRRSG